MGSCIYTRMQNSHPALKSHFHWHAATQAALRRSFSHAGREQFSRYPPDGTFLPEIRFQLWKSTLFFPPHRPATESDACSGYCGRKGSLVRTNLRVGALQGGVGAAPVFLFSRIGD